MKILIDNSGYELKNFGDIAMLHATINRIKSLSPNIEIYVFTQEPLRLKAISPDVVPVDVKGRNDWLQTWNLVGSLHRLFPHRLKFQLRRFEFLFKSSFPKLAYSIIKSRMKVRKRDHYAMRDFLALIDSVDLVIATGGGFVNDEFPIHAYNVLRTIRQAQKINKSTAMIGQGLGPISDKELVSICRQVFPHLDALGLRESVYSHDIALAMGAKADRVKTTGDDAIELAYQLRALDIGNNLGLNLRVAKYSNLNQDSIDKIRHSIKSITDKRKLDILPIAISIHEGDSDIRTLSNVLGVELNESQFFSVDSVIQAVGKCQLVITGSYHAGVFALSQGIPVIGIAASDYYRQKFEGLKNQFGAEACYVLDMNDAQAFSSLENIALRLIDNPNEKRERLLSKAKEQISKSNELIKQIIEAPNDKKK